MNTSHLPDMIVNDSIGISDLDENNDNHSNDDEEYESPKISIGAQSSNHSFHDICSPFQCVFNRKRFVMNPFNLLGLLSHRDQSVGAAVLGVLDGDDDIVSKCLCVSHKSCTVSNQLHLVHLLRIWTLSHLRIHDISIGHLGPFEIT